MPSLQQLEISVSPLADPLTYPGEIVHANYLWLDSWVYGIDAGPSGPALSAWRIRVDGGPLAAAWIGTGSIGTGSISAGSIGAGSISASLTGEGSIGARGSTPHRPVANLDDALSVAGAAPMSLRRPVVSFGSNSAPAQLRDKFAALSVSGRVLPVLRGSIDRLSLGYSAHVSHAGYVPYVLVDNGADARLAVSVLWLDSRQLAVLSGTEPNYDLVGVPADRYPLTMDNGERLSRYVAYKGKWGALRFAVSNRAAPAGTQAELFGRLGGFDWFRSLAGTGGVRAQIARLRADGGLRDRIRHELADRQMVAPDGWAALTE